MNSHDKMISQSEKLNFQAGIFHFLTFVPFVQPKGTETKQRKCCLWLAAGAWRRPACWLHLLVGCPTLLPQCPNTLGKLLVNLIVFKPREIFLLRHKPAADIQILQNISRKLSAELGPSDLSCFQLRKEPGHQAKGCRRLAPSGDWPGGCWEFYTAHKMFLQKQNFICLKPIQPTGRVNVLTPRPSRRTEPQEQVTRRPNGALLFVMLSPAGRSLLLHAAWQCQPVIYHLEEPHENEGAHSACPRVKPLSHPHSLLSLLFPGSFLQKYFPQSQRRPCNSTRSWHLR